MGTGGRRMLTTVINWEDDFRGGMDEDILEKINQKLDTALDNTKLENISRITIEIDEYEDEFVE
jgi:hypothetical protein